MRTDDFDDAIRKKLESIDYAFKEDDIERIHRYVRKNSSYIPFWKRYFQLFILSANGLLLMGSLFWNYKQMEQQEVFLKNIETLQKTVAQTKANATHSNIPDTIVVLKYVSSGVENNSSNYSTLVPLKGKDRQYIFNTITDQDEQIAGKNGSAKYDRNNSVFAGKPGFYNRGLDAKGLLATAVKNGKTNNGLKENDYSTDLLSQNELIKTENLQLNGTGTSSQNYLESTNNKKNQDQNTIYLSKAQSQKDSVVIDSLLKENKISKDSGSSPKVVKKELHIKNHLSLKNLGYRAGWGIEKSNNQFGVALVGELFVSKRFSINTGLKLLNITNDHYIDTDDFYDKKKEPFNTNYAPNVADTAVVSEINMRYNIVQLPVSLNYYQPLNRTYSLLFSAGTDLDLQTKIHLQYQLGNPKTQQQSNSKHPNVLFNNIVLSFGIQKEWNRFNIQLSPFASPQLRSVDYKKENFYGGLRVRVFYRFK